MSASADRDAALAAALAAWEEAGGQVDVDWFCRRWAHAGPELRDALLMHRALARLGRGRVPARLGRYLVGEELGRGGMAPVFRARDQELGRDVALKVLVSDPSRPRARDERFAREARALAQLDHPHVVGIHDVGHDGDFTWYAMELCAGSLADAPLPPPPARYREAARLAHEAALGLAAAHRAGILHRDVKPANLLLDGDGRVRVADFGLARFEDEGSLTATGEVLGTLRYAAPEQLLGRPSTVASDVHGLGKTLLFLATGDPPPGRPELLPRALARIVRRATALRPDARHRDMEELAAELRAFVDGRAPPRRARRLAALALALPAAAAVGWAARSEAPLPAGWTIWQGTRAAWAEAEPFRSLRRAAAPWPVEAALGDRGLVLVRDGRPVAEVALANLDLHPDPARWRVAPPLDADGDGAPETVLEGGGRVVVVKWGAPSLGVAGSWLAEADHRMGYGSPAVADWDGDGRPEVLLADEGTSGTGLVQERATFYALDAATGERRLALRLDGVARSTPQLLRDGLGRVRETWLDLETGAAGGLSGGLWRLAPGAAPERIPLRGAGHTLTWPAFADVDGDGEEELLVGGTSGRVYCLARRAPHATLWTVDGDGPLSYLHLGEQDGEPGDEVCYGSATRFSCLRTAPGLDAARRVAWSVPLPGGCVARPIEIPDLDGDGRRELACGAARGATAAWIVSAAADRPIALEAPAAAREGAGLHPFFAARLLALPRGDATLVVGATTTGWVLAWRVAAGAAPALLWARGVGAPIVASPQEVDGGVLVADYQGWLQLLDPEDGAPRWGYRARGAVGGTPAIVDGGLVFADVFGTIYRVPLAAPRPTTWAPAR
jgi:outer membrane protein assembly factor BamB